MNLKEIFRRAVSILFIVSILSFAAITHAEIYTGEGSYVMSDGENLSVAKERAKADAMQNAQEKAGTYIQRVSKTKNFELVEDEVIAISSSIVKLIENPYFYPVEKVANLGGFLIRVTVKVQIDNANIIGWLNKDEQEKSTLVAQNDALRKANAEQARQIAELKRQFANKPQDQLANNPQEKERITQAFAAEDKIFLSNQKVEEANRLLENRKYNLAISIFHEALELNPNNSLAWYGLGIATIQSNNSNNRETNKIAIQYLDKSIQLNPNFDDAYRWRGLAYGRIGQTEQEIQNLDKAIQLNPNNHYAYYNRGRAYYALRVSGKDNLRMAFQDFNKAIQLKPNFASAYQYRGFCYRSLGDRKKAQADDAKFRELRYKR